ncbi:MAG: type II toxin-antitoxin system PemK/MazF family toxin [Anaerolineae bacterium]|nr:type II toxin-antitoxin system PemK/MazF family toxin [Anaerolineae bacterium]
MVWLSFSPQAGRRPAVALSPEAYNARTGLALFCPVTSQVKGYPFEVAIPDNEPVSGVILADQVKSLDWRARQAEWIISLPAHTVEEVLAKIATLLD